MLHTLAGGILGTIMLSTTTVIPLFKTFYVYNCSIYQWAQDFSGQFRGPSEIWL